MTKVKAISLVCLTMCLAVAAVALGHRAELASKIRGLASVEAVGRSEHITDAPAPASTPTNVVAMTASQKYEVPEYMPYEQLFRLTVSFKKKNDEQKFRGEQVTPLTDYFRNGADLSHDESSILDQLSARYVEEFGEIDIEARARVQNIRSKVPKGRKTISRKFLTPTQNLRALQEKREQLAFRYRDYLKQSLGSDEFEGSASSSRTISKIHSPQRPRRKYGLLKME